jgi:hypothetical protein
MRQLNRRYALLLLVTACIVGSAPVNAGARESTCPDVIKPQAALKASSLNNGGTSSPDDVEAVSLAPISADGVAIGKATLALSFGRERSEKVRTQTFLVPPGVDPDTVRVSTLNDFVDGNDALPIAHQQLTYRAGKSPDGEHVNVRVCYDPGGLREPDPGNYVGALWVKAPGAKPALLTVEFSLSDDDLTGVIAALLIGILAGVVLQALAIRQQAPKDKRPTGFRSYFLNFRILIAAGGGAVAAIGAYSKLVAGDPTWDGSVSSLFSLVTATFGATVVTKAAIDLKGPTETEKKDGLAS